VIDNAEAGYGWSLTPSCWRKRESPGKFTRDIGEGLDAAGFWAGPATNHISATMAIIRCCIFHQYQKRPGQQSSGTKSENRDQYPEERNAIRHLSAGRSGE